MGKLLEKNSEALVTLRGGTPADPESHLFIANNDHFMLGIGRFL
jgi:hypothetical protein